MTLRATLGILVPFARAIVFLKKRTPGKDVLGTGVVFVATLAGAALLLVRVAFAHILSATEAHLGEHLFVYAQLATIVLSLVDVALSLMRVRRNGVAARP